MTTHRRRFLHLCGVAGLGAIAGCSNGNQDSATPTSTETETSVKSPVATLTPTPDQPQTETTTETVVSGTQQAKLSADDGDRSDEFGSSVAVSSDATTAIIGAENDDDPNGEGAGSAYVFDSSGGYWTQQTKLTANDGDRSDEFGSSVAVSSDATTVLIGAQNDENSNKQDAGSVYVFESSGGSWTQQAKLTANDSDNDDRFGRSVALSNDGTTALIGTYKDEISNNKGAGSAYIFDGSGGSWTQQAKLSANDSNRFDWFGHSVAMSSDGTTALIGAWHALSERAGSAYVFGSSSGSWTQQAKLSADDSDGGDAFGSAVAMSNDGNTALIGSHYDEDPNGEDAGSAYVFDSSGGSWTQQAKLSADDSGSGDYLGWSVSLSGDGNTALISAHKDEDPNGEKAGSAYVFVSSGDSWTQQAKLSANDGDSGDVFGLSTAVSSDGTTALIGAEKDEDPNGNDAGSAYLFNI